MSSIERYRSPEAEERAFAVLERKVNALVKSNLIPDAVRGKPGDALLVALKGYELGLSFTASFAHLFVVNGRIGQSAQLLADEANNAGYEVYVGNDSDATQATAYVVNRRTGQRHSLTWTIDDARRAGLLEKDNWKRYPAAMLRARAISNAVRAFCRGVVLPADVVLETPDELGADIIEFEDPERGELTPASSVVAASSQSTADTITDGGLGEESATPSATHEASSEAPAGESTRDVNNVFAKAVHIEAHRVGLAEEELDEILFEICGDVSANAVTRDNVETVVARIRAAKEPAA